MSGWVGGWVGGCVGGCVVRPRQASRYEPDTQLAVLPCICGLHHCASCVTLYSNPLGLLIAKSPTSI